MDNARAFCKKNFGDLATIKSESEKKFLWKYVRLWLGVEGHAVNKDNS